MAEEFDEFVPEQVLLPEPRPLTARERELIDFLVAGPLGRAELREQAKVAQVIALCSCGCPSVFIEVDHDEPAARFSKTEVPSGDTDAVALTAYSLNPMSSTQVTLHVVGGYMAELEIWARQFGARPRPNPAKLEYAELLYPDSTES